MNLPWQPGPLRKAWYRWKMLRLPWRKQWLIGFDLQGNTFWEFQDALNSNRYRRIVKYSRWTHHGDVKVPPQWMQWLRHTRFDPPSLSEQQGDIVRQERIKVLAAEADKRWAEKPSVLDSPDKQQPIELLISRDPHGSVGQTNTQQQTMDEGRAPNVEAAPHGQEKEAEPAPPAEVPKKQTKPEQKDTQRKLPATSNPGEDWKPESWTPKPAGRRG